MPATYEKIATSTLSSDSSSIDFTSIPSTYTDLRVVVVGTGAGGLLRLQFNASGSGYSSTNVYANSATGYKSNNASSITITDAGVMGIYFPYPQLFTIDIFSYTGSSFKHCLFTGNQEMDNVNGIVNRGTGQWRSTSAINQLTISVSSGVLYTGTRVSIYGIKAA